MNVTSNLQNKIIGLQKVLVFSMTERQSSDVIDDFVK